MKILSSNGCQLRWLRKRLGLNQIEAANLLFISQSRISGIESGLYDLSDRELVAYSEILYDNITEQSNQEVENESV